MSELSAISVDLLITLLCLAHQLAAWEIGRRRRELRRSLGHAVFLDTKIYGRSEVLISLASRRDLKTPALGCHDHDKLIPFVQLPSQIS